MIITRTPLRVSFCGGGTDLRAYYQFGYGAVLSTTIDKYIYVIVNKSPENFRICYSRIENIRNVKEIKHNLIREALRMCNIKDKLHISIVSDVPEGSGLGSSSSLAVGILNALYAYKGEKLDKKRLAENACKLEIDILNEPIGKQDQYAAAFGGLNFITFHKDESVKIERVKIEEKKRKILENSLLLFYTGIKRKSSIILKEQRDLTLRDEKKRKILDKMRKQAFELKMYLENGDIDMVGNLLKEGWKYKKQMAGKITNPIIEAYYKKAIKAGALGGKILGAGGGGFLLFFVKKEKQEYVKRCLDLKEMPFKFEREGSKIIYMN